MAGYIPLRADGETFAAGGGFHTFRPWLLALLPGLGGLACGLLTRLTPEIRGGGGDAMIEAFHYEGGQIKSRVIWTKALASMFTLGTGGAGGREGPTMQIGGALGTLVGRVLQVSTRERRILMVAGVAAGISAVFRTPLGAALLAVEVLYRDGFESDALIPAVLASVVSYSVIISIFGESTLFAHVPRYPFVPAHLPLFLLLALLIAAVSVGLSEGVPGPRAFLPCFASAWLGAARARWSAARCLLHAGDYGGRQPLACARSRTGAARWRLRCGADGDLGVALVAGWLGRGGLAGRARLLSS